MNELTASRVHFFDSVAAEIGEVEVMTIVLTHILPDRPELLKAINSVARISLIIAIPYSINKTTLCDLQKSYRVATPTMEQLLDVEFLAELIGPSLQMSEHCILEIGGYFGNFLNEMQSRFPGRIRGFVEDTEHGHRIYEQSVNHNYPIVSVARSPLKAPEDALVGPSCVFSAELLLRSRGELLHGKKALVMGYGKVGRGCAYSLLGRGCSVAVFDSDPIKMCVALAEGFLTPERTKALKSADLIFGCSGFTSITIDALQHLRPGCVLVSCSSKRIEFDIDAIERMYLADRIDQHITRYSNESHHFFVFAGGNPINYLDNAIIGPALSLVQAEIIYALKQVADTPVYGSVSQVDKSTQRRIATLWNHSFCNPESGGYN